VGKGVATGAGREEGKEDEDGEDGAGGYRSGREVRKPEG